MNDQKRKNIILVICMIICVIITSLLCTKSLECSSCDEKITGKHYVSILSGSPLCKECGKEYYRGYPGDLDNVSDKVDNTLRDILLIIEILGFGLALVTIKKKESAKDYTSYEHVEKLCLSKESAQKIIDEVNKEKKIVVALIGIGLLIFVIFGYLSYDSISKIGMMIFIVGTLGGIIIREQKTYKNALEFMKNNEYSKRPSIIKKEPIKVVEPKPSAEPKTAVEPKTVVTPTSASKPDKTTVSGGTGRLKTTFKPVSDIEVLDGPGTQAKTHPSDNDKFKAAGDL